MHDVAPIGGGTAVLDRESRSAGDMRRAYFIGCSAPAISRLSVGGCDADDVAERGRWEQRRAGWRLVGRQVGNLVKVAREVHQTLKADEMPEWARVPKRVPHVPFGPDRPETVTVEVNLTAEDLTDAREIIARLITELRDWGGADGPLREVECWLSLDESGQIAVHVGTDEVARLRDSASITNAIRQWGRRTRTLRASGILRGADAAAATLELDVDTPVA
jgi:hypothetical protein